MNPITPLLTLIAQQYLDIDTLETRNADSMDFHEVAVWNLRDALDAAFKAGVEVGHANAKIIEQDLERIG